MTEPARDAMSAAWEAAIDALRQSGAPVLDPVRFRYVERLSRRLDDAHPEVRPRLLTTLERAIAECEDRLRARATQTLVVRLAGGDEAPDRLVPEAPAAEPELARLNRYIATASAPGQADELDLRPGEWEPFAGLRNAARFRESWQRMCAEDAVDHAFGRAPESAGPLNSHHLVLRLIAQMQALSPAYLRHFVTQAQTLLWLERNVPVAKRPTAKAGKRRASR